MSSTPITIVIADDHAVVRQGLRLLLEAEDDLAVVGESSDIDQTSTLLRECTPAVVLLDLHMGRDLSLSALFELRSASPSTAVVILTMEDDPAFVAPAWNAGAAGYVLKESSSDELVKAIRAVTTGRRYLSPPLSEEALGTYSRRTGSLPPDPYHTLTAREREVLQLTAEGHSGADIAERLFISPRTVETHRANLMRKLKVRNQKELIRYALQRTPQAPGPLLSRSG